MGHVAPTTGIVHFSALVKKVMSTEPYASARRVYWVVDNGSSHAGRASMKRMAEAWPRATLVHLPVHASWLNQVEVVFSVIQRKVVKGGDFADLSALADALVRFEARYNTTARAFDWTFTRADLAELCRRIDAHAGPGELTLAA
jgi:DDE superfamily endonuclease